MRILYISQKDIDIKTCGISSDLINALIGAKHEVVICCADSKYEKTRVCTDGIKKVEIKVPNQFGVNIIRKGLIILSLERVIKKAIKKYLSDEKFDLVLYATPPITLANVVKYCKKKFGCKSYLMLKDIFPQNAVDLNMMSTGGITGILYRMFRIKEKKLYEYSDAIGCMSNANIEYLQKHNPYLKGKKIELFPNAVAVKGKPERSKDKYGSLSAYGIKDEDVVFIYGGNLGKPQGLDFLEKALKNCADVKGVHFIIIGKGSEKDKLFKALEDTDNVTTLEALPKNEYDRLCALCDVGMIMLDKRFTIPNYPSRMLSYLENAMPIFACTDKNTDVRQLVEEQARCGKWCYSDDMGAFRNSIEWFSENKDSLKALGENGYNYMAENFNVQDNVKRLENFINE